MVHGKGVIERKCIPTIKHFGLGLHLSPTTTQRVLRSKTKVKVPLDGIHGETYNGLPKVLPQRRKWVHPLNVGRTQQIKGLLRMIN